MNSKIIKLFLLGVVLFAGSTFAEGGDSKNNSNTLYKSTSADPIRAFLNINFISTVIKNDGISDINVGQDASGLIYPIGSGKTAVFTSGFLWSANVNDPNEQDPHVGGTVYRTGLQAGWIDASGNVITDDPRVRIYRVRPNVSPGAPSVDLGVEAQDENKSESDVRAQYELDWTEWPADLGAPYKDGNGNGVYDAVPDPDPEMRDIPGVPGADQTIWYVANDQEEARTSFMYGTQPMGLEMQATFWAYRQTGALGNMYFRRYVIINKTDVLPIGPRTFDSMYVSMWSDPDIGNASDDFAGSDTVLSITYAYNGTAIETIYGGTPPAVGFDFFQGPLVEGVAGQDKNKNGVDDADDFGIFNNQNVGPGLINLPMTAAYYYINDDPTLTDPIQGSYPEGAVRWGRFMQGRIGLTNLPFVDPNTGASTPFTLPGDPVTRTGWIDGQQFSPGDRRIGAASGPFTMEPGDTQEVVVAEIVAGAVTGVDRLSAVSLMKFYDQIAQVAYDNFFDLPTPPPPPSVDAGRLDGTTNIWYALDKEIILDWSQDLPKVADTELSSSKGYSFQGYNVYQLPSVSASVIEGKRIATFDVKDGVGKIDDFVFDPVTGSVVVKPVQFGNDTGVKRIISITEDAIDQRPLINGIKYYFAVTAYNFNPDPQAVPNNLENPARTFTIVPQSPDPGVTYGEGTGSDIEVTHTNGLADGGPVVTIVDPTSTTGHTYEITFVNQPQIRNAQGFWVPAGTSTVFGPDTLTGTTITAGVVFPPDGSVPVEMGFFLDVIHHYYGWVDGVILTFPSNVTIISSPSFEAGGGTIDPVIIGQEIHYGITDNSATGNGILHDGGESWTVTLESIEDKLPITVLWTAFDDGYAGGGDPLDGSTTVSEIGEAMRSADLWNVTDLATGNMVLQERNVVNGVLLYPPTDFTNTDVGVDAAPIVDGFQINQVIGYAAPVTFVDALLTLNGESLSRNDGSRMDYDDFTVFGVVPATAANANLGIGTSDPALLVQDYEMRFTADSTAIQNIGGVNVEVTVSGGSIATLYGARGYDIAIHPLNPNPGSSAPFTIRIPFEVWSIDQDKQINYMVYDREGDPTADDPFRAWNTMGRMYCAYVLTDYAETVIPLTDPSLPAAATWNTVWWGSQWESGDVIQAFYANNVVPGVDTYTFTTTASSFSDDLAGSQTNQINVFPNPYYGVNTEEINKYNRFVTFNHLPDLATVRIFTLAGVLVKTIDKTEPGQFLRWDLANQDGLPVASGLYIAYIELKTTDGTDLGTKILKLAIVQEQQILDRF